VARAERHTLSKVFAKSRAIIVTCGLVLKAQ